MLFQQVQPAPAPPPIDDGANQAAPSANRECSIIASMIYPLSGEGFTGFAKDNLQLFCFFKL